MIVTVLVKPIISHCYNGRRFIDYSLNQTSIKNHNIAETKKNNNIRNGESRFYSICVNDYFQHHRSIISTIYPLPRAFSSINRKELLS